MEVDRPSLSSLFFCHCDINSVEFRSSPTIHLAISFVGSSDTSYIFFIFLFQDIFVSSVAIKLLSVRVSFSSIHHPSTGVCVCVFFVCDFFLSVSS